jgi:hypothetical protein
VLARAELISGEEVLDVGAAPARSLRRLHVPPQV